MYDGKVFFLKNSFHNKINSHDSYILDSNVVIKFRDLYYSPHKMSSDEVEYYIGLLEFFKDKDVVPGIAIQELSWDFERFETDEIKLRRLLNAMNALFSYDEKTFSRIKAQCELISDNKPVKNGKRKFNSLYLNADANLSLLPSFCTMLKYHQVMRVNSDNINRYIDLCNFLMNTLKLVGAYELALITEILFSTDNKKTKAIISMLKIESDSNLLSKIWNSCWDLFFLRFITGFATNTLNNEPTEQIFNPVLVTRDINLYNVGSHLENNNEVVIADRVYTGISGGYEYSEEVTQLITEMNLIISQKSKERIEYYHNTSETQIISNWKEIIQNLESELTRVRQ
jgi:hypothetical protein